MTASYDFEPLMSRVSGADKVITALKIAVKSRTVHMTEALVAFSEPPSPSLSSKGLLSINRPARRLHNHPFNKPNADDVVRLTLRRILVRNGAGQGFVG